MKHAVKLAVLASMLASGAAMAAVSVGNLYQIDTTENLASFSGNWSFDTSGNILTVNLSNAGSGVMTALAFDRPDTIPGIDAFSFTHTGATARGFNWQLFSNADDNDLPPFGTDYDHSVSHDGNLAGGSPQGILAGETAQFVFDMADTAPGAPSLLSQLDRPEMVLRFQAIPPYDGSDKIAVGGFNFFTAPPPIPEPETYAMLLAGLPLLFARKWQAKRRGHDSGNPA